MQYYRIGETLELLESLPPEEKSILAVLCPEELSGALLPQGLTPPQPPEDLRENQYCWLHIRQGALRGRCACPNGARSPCDGWPLRWRERACCWWTTTAMLPSV